MGAELATTNKDLVDKLVDKYFYKNSQVEGAFRAVDRAMYYELEDEVEINPYDGNPWRQGNLHLSAPCIYVKVVDALNLKPGMSFLNLGSGTGYLNTIVGLLIGPNGVNHGIEIHADVVEFANKKLREFLDNTSAIDKYDFSEPTFICGNCVNLNPATTSYDRIYLGASCLPGMETFMKKLVKPNGGILVMPYEDRLMRHIRVGDNEWLSEELMEVKFTMMIRQNDEDKETTIELPQPMVKSLKSLCRIIIRQQLRNQTNWLNPNLLNSDNVDRRRHRRAMATLAMRRAEQQRQQARMIASLSNAANQSQSATSAAQLKRTTYDGAINMSCQMCYAKRHQQTTKRKCRKCCTCGGRHRSKPSLMVSQQEPRNRLTNNDDDDDDETGGNARYNSLDSADAATNSPTTVGTNTRMMTRSASRLVRTDDAISTLPATSTTTSERNQTTDNDDHNSYTTPNEHTADESSGEDDGASGGYANMSSKICNILYPSRHTSGRQAVNSARNKLENSRRQQRPVPMVFQNDNYTGDLGPSLHRSALLRPIDMFPFQAFTFAEILHDQPMARFMRQRFENQFGASRRNLFQIFDPASNEALDSSSGDDSSSSSSRYSDIGSDIFVDAREDHRRGNNRESSLGESWDSFLEHAYANDNGGSSNDSDDDDTQSNMERESTESDDWSVLDSSSSLSSVRSLCSSVSSTSSVWGSDLFDDDDEDEPTSFQRVEIGQDEPVASRLRSKLVLHREPWRQATATTSGGSSSSFRSAVSQLFAQDHSLMPSSSSGGRTTVAKARADKQQGNTPTATNTSSIISSDCCTHHPANKRHRQRHCCSCSQASSSQSVSGAVNQSRGQLAPQIVNRSHSSRVDSLLLSPDIVGRRRLQNNLGLPIISPKAPALSSTLPLPPDTIMKPHNLLSKFSLLTKRLGCVGEGSSSANRNDGPSNATLSAITAHVPSLSPLPARLPSTLAQLQRPVRVMRSTSVATAAAGGAKTATSAAGCSLNSVRLARLTDGEGAELVDASRQEQQSPQQPHKGSVGRKRKRRSSSESSESNASSPRRRQAGKSKAAPSGTSYRTRLATRAANTSHNMIISSASSPRAAATSAEPSVAGSSSGSSGPSLLAARRRVVMLDDDDDDDDDDSEEIDDTRVEERIIDDVKLSGSMGSAPDSCSLIQLAAARLGSTSDATRPAPGGRAATILSQQRRDHCTLYAPGVGQQNSRGISDSGHRHCSRHHHCHHHHHHHRHRVHQSHSSGCRRHCKRHRRHSHQHRHCRHRQSASLSQHNQQPQHLSRNHWQAHSNQYHFNGQQQQHHHQVGLERHREFQTRRRVERERRVKRSGGPGPGFGLAGAGALASLAGGAGERSSRGKKKKENECEKYRSHISVHIRRLPLPLVLHDYLNFDREFV